MLQLSLSIFDMLLLPPGLGALFISWWGGKHPFMPVTQTWKNQNIFSIARFSCLFFDLLLLPSGLGDCLYNGAKHPFMQATQAKKIKIFALLHAFLVYFLTCCCFPQGWGPCLFHGANDSFLGGRPSGGDAHHCYS